MGNKPEPGVGNKSDPRQEAYKPEYRNDIIVESFKIKKEKPDDLVEEELKHPSTTMRILEEDYQTLRFLSGLSGKSMKQVISSLVVYEKEKFYKYLWS